MNYLDYFIGVSIIIQWEHEVGDQKRKHKKKRINKKMVKKIWGLGRVGRSLS